MIMAVKKETLSQGNITAKVSFAQDFYNRTGLFAFCLSVYMHTLLIRFEVFFLRCRIEILRQSSLCALVPVCQP